MHSQGRSSARALAAGLLLAAGIGVAWAGAEIKLSDDASINVGFGIRTSYTRNEMGAPDGTSDSNDFNVENARLFFSGTYAKIFKATFNTERTGGPASSGGDSVRVMDAIAQIEPMPEFNFWIGRFLPPSDRANLYGPFYALPWSYPGTVSNYPNLAVGRDNGAMVWGKPFNGKVVYSIGAFEGHNKVAGLSGQSDKLLYAGRLAFNIWDPEPAPAHYTGGWYGGSANILTVAIAGNSQADGVGTAAASGKLDIWSADLLFEKKFSIGVPTVEAAYYKYKLGALDCNSGEPGAPVCTTGDNVGGQVDGKAMMLVLGFLFPDKVGPGQFQPFFRFQKYERTVSATEAKTTDIGVNYLVKGPNVKFSLVYSKLEDSRNAAPRDDLSQILAGFQFIY